MPATPTEILAAALQLSEQDRANLAVSLIDSLDPTIDSDWEAAWDQEIGQRVEQLQQGTVKTIPWEDVRQKLRGKLGGRTTS